MSAASLISSTKGLLSRLRLGQKQREDKTYAQLVAAGSISDALHQGRLNELDLGLVSGNTTGVMFCCLPLCAFHPA